MQAAMHMGVCPWITMDVSAPSVAAQWRPEGLESRSDWYPTSSNTSRGELPSSFCCFEGNDKRYKKRRCPRVPVLSFLSMINKLLSYSHHEIAPLSRSIRNAAIVHRCRTFSTLFSNLDSSRSHLRRKNLGLFVPSSRRFPPARASRQRHPAAFGEGALVSKPTRCRRSHATAALAAITSNRRSVCSWRHTSGNFGSLHCDWITAECSMALSKHATALSSSPILRQ